MGLQAFRAKGPGWLWRGPWAPLAASFCSQGPVGAGRPEPGPRPTSVRQRDGIRSAARPPAPWPPGVARGGTGLFPVWSGGGEGRGAGERETRRGSQASRLCHPTQSPVGALLVVSAARCCEFLVIRHCRIQLTGGIADTVLKQVPYLGTVPFGTLRGSHWGVSSATASEGPSTPPKHLGLPGSVVIGLSSSAGDHAAAVAFEKAFHWKVLCLSDLTWLQGHIRSSGAALWPSPRSAGSVNRIKDTPY